MPVEPGIIAHSLEAVEWPSLLQALEERVATVYGHAERARLRFLDEPAAIRRSLARIEELRGLIGETGPLDLSGVQPIDGLLERAEKAGRLEAGELAAILATQQRIRAAGDALLRPMQYPLLRELAGEIHHEDELVAALDSALTPTGELNERAFPALVSLRDEITACRDAIHRHLDSLLRSRALEPVLQDKVFTLRGHRYVLPVKVECKGQLPGIVHDVSASGATLFVEPQAIVDETNTLTLLEKQLELEQDRILRELSGRVGFSASSLRHNTGWLGRVDLWHAQALLSRDMQGSAPEVGTEGEIALKGIAHPLMLLAGADVVRNDVRLGADVRCLIVSGANTGGKTILLKALGLSALLVRAGMHIPALPGSRMDLFTDFWADVGDRQDLRASLSTFSAQIEFLSRVLNAAGHGSLVLLDELLTGTEPTEGAALARQVVAALVAQGAKTVVTTHYGELKLLAGQVPGVVNGSVSFDGERLRPTFRFTLGTPGASYAIPIASRHGLPDDLVRRAVESLADRPAALEALLRGLHAQQEQTQAVRTELERERRELERRTAELERRATHLNDLQTRLKRQERGAISRELREARERIGAVIKELQGANSLPLAGKVRERLAALEGELLPPSPAPPASHRAAPAPGERVYVVSLERTGVLQEVVDEGATARVQFGPLTLEVPAEELLPPPAAPTPRRRQWGGAPPRRPTVAVNAPEEIPHVFQTAENTLDVRGRTLEEAVQQTEAFFDRCIVKHVTPVLVIHGHGTGRLKVGLRERFSASRYVARFRPGGPGEGRDGVTVVALNV
jgi:DNA mismatch repair protein MutS2